MNATNPHCSVTDVNGYLLSTCACIAAVHSVQLPTPTVVAGRVYSGLCMSVCLSVCLFVFPPDILKFDAARITKLDIEMFHHLFWSQ